MEEQMSQMAKTIADQAVRIKQLEADHVVLAPVLSALEPAKQNCDICDLVRTCVNVAPTDAPTTSTTTGVVCPELEVEYPDLVEVDLNLGEVTQSNLGGAGPDSGEAELYYKNAAVHKAGSDVAYDLKVTVIGDSYTANNVDNNGQNGYYGQINVLCNTSVDLKFQFIDQKTGEPAAIQTVISWFDTDMGMLGGGKESILAWPGYAKTLLASNSELEED